VNFAPVHGGVGGRARRIQWAEAKLDIATPTAGEYFVNVHKSAADLKTNLACGDLALEDVKAKPSSGY
jgi:hypothetical protein